MRRSYVAILLLYSVSVVADDVQKLFQFEVGKAPSKIELPTTFDHPIFRLRVPTVDQFGDTFHDYEITISLITGNVARINAARSFRSSDECYSHLRKMAAELESQYGQKMRWNDAEQFQSSDGTRSLQLHCARRVGTEYHVLNLDLTDSSENERAIEWYRQRIPSA